MGVFETVKKQREENVTFRILSAFGIIFVVMGHEGYNQFEFGMWLPYYSYHMALFAFISGYFFSEKNDCYPIRFLLKKARTILLPFFTVSFFYLLLQTCLHKNGITFGLEFSLYNWLVRPWVKCQPLGFNIATWYMIALFLTETLYIFLRTSMRIVRGQLTKNLMLLLVLGIGASSVVSKSPYPEEWQRVWIRPVFLCFFCHVGYCYKRYIEANDRVSASARLMTFFLIKAVLIPNYGKGDYGLWDCNFGFQPWWVVFLSTGIGIEFWLTVAKLISPIVSTDGILIQIGRHTREIMSHHLFVAFLWHGGIYMWQKALKNETSLNLMEWRTKLYYRYIPWDGYNLITVIVILGCVLLAVYVKENFAEALKRVLHE